PPGTRSQPSCSASSAARADPGPVGSVVAGDAAPPVPPDRSTAMLVDSGVPGDLERVPKAARRAEEFGYDGVWSAETGHDPFLPLLLAAEHSERLDLGTGIAVAFARNPMTLALQANDLNLYSKGRFILGLGSQIKPHIEKRYSMPWSHPAPRMRELIQ